MQKSIETCRVDKVHEYDGLLSIELVRFDDRFERQLVRIGRIVQSIDQNVCRVHFRIG